MRLAVYNPRYPPFGAIIREVRSTSVGQWTQQRQRRGVVTAHVGGDPILKLPGSGRTGKADGQNKGYEPALDALFRDVFPRPRAWRHELRSLPSMSTRVDV
jgi:hypothetical protein